jgi:hypothetical protein
MAQTNSTLVQTSRYVAGGATEANARALEWWERSQLVIDDTDRTYTVELKAVGRLDLLAAAYLDDSALWWVIAQYNAILDPVSEIVVGRVLRIPTKERVQTFLNGKLGGYESTREVPLSNITPIV